MARKVLKFVRASCTGKTAELCFVKGVERRQWLRQGNNASRVVVIVSSGATIALLSSDSIVRSGIYYSSLFLFEPGFLEEMIQKKMATEKWSYIFSPTKGRTARVDGISGGKEVRTKLRKSLSETLRSQKSIIPDSFSTTLGYHSLYSKHLHTSASKSSNRAMK